MGNEQLPARLSIDGATIRKPNGNPIFLRGVNWGSWGHNVESDADDMVAWGANCVRVALRTWGLYGEANVDALDWNAYAHLAEDNLKRVLSEIDWLTSRGLWVIPFLDSNCGQNGLQSPADRTYCDPNGLFPTLGRNFWTDHPMRSTFKSAWRHYAAQLRRRPNIALLEILPEPLGERGAEWAGPCRDFYRDLITTIREVDADTPILTGPRNSYDITLAEEALLEERGDIVYTGNLIGGKMTGGKFEAFVAHLVAMRDTHNVPVFVQQLGRKSENDRDLVHMRAGLQHLSDEGIGYTWWQNKQKGASLDSYGLHVEDGRGGWTPKDGEISVLQEFLQAGAATR